MRKLVTFFFPAFIVLLLSSGCASSYRKINPEQLKYHNSSNEDNIHVAYRYDVLASNRNKKNAKKERKNGINVIALQVTNNTPNAISIGDNAQLFIGDNPALIMEPQEAMLSLRQNVPIYLLYGLLTLLRLDITRDEGRRTQTTDSYPIGLVIGPAVTAGNMIMAGSSNKSLKNNLIQQYIFGKEIPPGATLSGLVCTRNMGYGPLRILLNED
ncbi:MAG: hypothetical protein AAGG75_26300 [Bacteroidota bacterium]